MAKRPREDEAPSRGALRGWTRYVAANSASYAEVREEVDVSQRSQSVQCRDRVMTRYVQENRANPQLYHRKLEAYTTWALQALPKGAPEVFRPADAKQAPPRFFDLGASPGGLSKYLHANLKWSGVAVSLPEAKGGMPLVYDGAGRRVVPGRPTSTMSGLGAASVRPPPSVAPFTKEEGDVTSAEDRERFFETEGREHGFDFAMAGAVMDVGQRDEAGDRLSFADRVERRVAFFAQQMRWALMALKPDGNLMFVFGPSECASLLCVTARLRPFVRGRITVLTTLHADKAPVYVVAAGVDASAECIAAVCDAKGVTDDAVKLNNWADTAAVVEGVDPADAPEEVRALLTTAVAEYTQLQAGLGESWSARAAKLRRNRELATKDMQDMLAKAPR